MELLNRGAMPEGKDSRLCTPLHACIFAARTGRYQHTFDSTDREKLYGKPAGGWPKPGTQFPFNFITILLSRGASLDARDHQGLTPLEYALEKTSKLASRVAKIQARTRRSALGAFTDIEC